jgi:hypothetical protein
VEEVKPPISDEEQQRKMSEKIRMMIATGIFQVISIAAAVKSKALLLENIAYYAACQIYLWVLAGDDSRSYHDFIQDGVVTRSSGTILKSVGSLANMIGILGWKGEGPFDIVHPMDTSSDALAKANMTFPQFDVTQYPLMHAYKGELNFGIGVGANMLMALTFSGETGKWLSRVMLADVKKMAVEMDDLSRRAQHGEEGVFAARVQEVERIIDGELIRRGEPPLGASTEGPSAEVPDTLQVRPLVESGGPQPRPGTATGRLPGEGAERAALVESRSQNLGGLIEEGGVREERWNQSVIDEFARAAGYESGRSVTTEELDEAKLVAGVAVSGRQIALYSQGSQQRVLRILTMADDERVEGHPELVPGADVDSRIVSRERQQSPDRERSPDREQSADRERSPEGEQSMRRVVNRGR